MIPPDWFQIGQEGAKQPYQHLVSLEPGLLPYCVPYGRYTYIYQTWNATQSVVFGRDVVSRNVEVSNSSLARTKRQIDAGWIWNRTCCKSRAWIATLAKLDAFLGLLELIRGIYSSINRDLSYYIVDGFPFGGDAFPTKRVSNDTKINASAPEITNQIFNRWYKF